jgi:hypothetical protein
MSNGVTLGPSQLEMNARYDLEPDKGKNMEVAMAATVFRDLQEKGYIPSGAKLADAPPADGNVEGRSYEARLVKLIGDADGNQKLDLDLDALKRSGILSKDATTDELSNVLGGKPNDRLSDAFMLRQSDKSNLQKGGALTDKGKAVQDYSNRLTLTTDRDRRQQAFLDGASNRAKASPEEAGRVRDEAINKAALLQKSGDVRRAQDLLLGTGDRLTEARRFDDAKKVYGEMKKGPGASTPLNLVEKQHEDQLKRTPKFDPASQAITIRRGGTKTTIDESSFKSTYGAVADRKLAQIDETERMSAFLGRDADPRKIEDTKAYFRTLAKDGSTDELRDEYQKHLKAFYAHSGQGVEWDKSVALEDRPKEVAKLFDGQPVDASGRKIIDCEGYAYLTGQVFGDLGRYDVLYAEKPGHIISGAFDRDGGGFTVNNDDVKKVPKGASRTSAGRFDAMAAAIAGGHYNVVRVGRSQADAVVNGPFDLPRTGSILWDGQKAIGVVDDEFVRDYQQHGGPGLSVSQFLKQRLERP